MIDDREDEPQSEAKPQFRPSSAVASPFGAFGAVRHPEPVPSPADCLDDGFLAGPVEFST